MDSSNSTSHGEEDMNNGQAHSSSFSNKSNSRHSSSSDHSSSRSRFHSRSRSASPASSSLSKKSKSRSYSRSRSRSFSNFDEDRDSGNSDNPRRRKNRHRLVRRSRSTSFTRIPSKENVNSATSSGSKSRSSASSYRSSRSNSSRSRSRSRSRSISPCPSATSIKSFNKRDPRDKSKRVKWDNECIIVGRKALGSTIHFCEICDLPILVYGRLLPCKHVFCHTCAKKSPTKCQHCQKPVQMIDRATVGGIFMCFDGGKTCRRTYLSQRDLQAHIDHRHRGGIHGLSSNKNSATTAVPTSSTSLTQASSTSKLVTNVSAPSSRAISSCVQSVPSLVPSGPTIPVVQLSSCRTISSLPNQPSVGGGCAAGLLPLPNQPPVGQSHHGGPIDRPRKPRLHGGSGKHFHPRQTKMQVSGMQVSSNLVGTQSRQLGMVPATSCLVGAGGSGMVPPVALQPACSSARLPIETGYGSGVGGCQSGSGAGSSGVNTGVGTLSGTGGSSGGQPSQSTASVPNPLAAMFAVAAAVQQQQHSQQQQQTHMRLPQPLASGAPGGGLNPAEMAALLLGGQSIRMQQHSGPGLSVPGSNMILRWPTSLLSSQTQGQQQHAMALSQHHQTGQGHCLLGSSSNTVSVSSNPGQGNLVLTPGGGLTLSMGLRPQVPSSQMHHAPPF